MTPPADVIDNRFAFRRVGGLFIPTAAIALLAFALVGFSTCRLSQEYSRILSGGLLVLSAFCAAVILSVYAGLPREFSVGSDGMKVRYLLRERDYRKEDTVEVLTFEIRRWPWRRQHLTEAWIRMRSGDVRKLGILERAASESLSRALSLRQVSFRIFPRA